MRTVLTAALLLALGASGCLDYPGNRAVAGSGRVVTETRAVANFDQVSIGGSGRLTVQQGDEESLTIQTDDNLLPFIQSKVSGGHLRLGPHQVNLRPTWTILYQLKLKNLRALRLSGSLDASAGQIKSDKFELQVSGSGKVHIGKLTTDQLDGGVSGSGGVEVSGRVKEQTIGVSGSGDFQAADLESEQADARVSGSGSVTVWTKNSLSAEVSGSGTIGYYGTPSIQKHVSGSGRVRSLGAR